MTEISLFHPCHLCGRGSAIKRLYWRQGWGIVRCARCGLVYVDGVPSKEKLEGLYSRDFFEVGEKYGDMPDGAGWKNAMCRVEELLKLPGIGRDRWLEIGSATGDFLRAAKPKVREVNGVELSEFAVQEARRRGVQGIIQGDFLSVVFEPSSYNLVAMWDFVEHVPDPLANLRKAFSLLKPGGYLALTTGDVESPFARWTGRFWPLLTPPTHLYFFSRRTIQRLLESAGFELIAIRYPGKYVPADFLVSKLASLIHPELGRFSLRLASRFQWGRFAPWLNLGDIMTVYGRKGRAEAVRCAESLA